MVRQCLRAAPPLAALSAALGVLVLVGYVAGLERLWRPLPDGPATHPLTAVCLIATGCAVWLARPRRASNLSLLLAVLTTIIGLTRVLVGPLGTSEFFDAITPFQGTMARAALAGMPVQMGLNTAATFLALGLALILRRYRWMAATQFFAALASLPPLVGLVGYIYGVPGFYGQMASTTMIGTLCAALGALMSTAHRGLLKGILSPWAAGRVARVQIVSLCGTCFLVGFTAARLNAAGNMTSLAAQTIFMSLVIVLVIGTGASIYDRIDHRRRTAERNVVQAAMVDPLTGLMNRRSFSSAVEPLFGAGARDGSIGVLIADVDFFKSINDRFGHDVGDSVLRRLGEIFRNNVRSSDIIGRMGGEEFAFVLPGATPAAAREVGESLRAALEAFDMSDIMPGQSAVTMSVGASAGSAAGSTLRGLLSSADAALYRAKADGRNCVVVNLQ